LRSVLVWYAHRTDRRTDFLETGPAVAPRGRARLALAFAAF
jgi:hypothetical protein